jgi:hypothetical protein
MRMATSNRTTLITVQTTSTPILIPIWIARDGIEIDPQ